MLERELFEVRPSNTMGVPTNRGGQIIGYLLMDKDAPYLTTKIVAERIKVRDPKCIVTQVDPKPFTPGVSEKVLVLFPGGIGDTICLNSCLRDFKKKYDVEVGVVSSLADEIFIKPWYDQIFDYPIRREIADYYDAWINIAELDRVSMDRELSDNFAQLMQIDAPSEPSTVIVDEKLKNSLSSFLSGSDRIKVGVQINSADHYRSLPALSGVLMMFELIANGCECYIIGSPEHRTVFTDGDRRPQPPPEHIYDMCGALTSNDMFVAFTDLMDAVLTVDTAALHIGGVLNKPTLGLFGLSDGSKRTSKYKSVEYIQGSAPCSPCNAIYGGPQCNEKWCIALAGIDPMVAAHKLLEVLSNERV